MKLDDTDRKYFIATLKAIGILLLCGAFTFIVVFIVSVITGESMCY